MFCDFFNEEDRLDIICVLVGKVKVDEEVWGDEGVLRELGRRMDGFSGVDL